MKLLIENDDYEIVSKMLNETDFVTKCSIDNLITYAIDNKSRKLI